VIVPPCLARAARSQPPSGHSVLPPPRPTPTCSYGSPPGRARTRPVTADGEPLIRLTAAGNELDLHPAAAPLLDALLAAPGWTSFATLADTSGTAVSDIALVVRELLAAQIAALPTGALS
jgi:hypothetical protein